MANPTEQGRERIPSPRRSGESTPIQVTPKLQSELDAIGGTGHIEATGELPHELQKRLNRQKIGSAIGARNKLYDPLLDPYGYYIHTEQVMAAIIKGEDIQQKLRIERKKLVRQFRDGVYGQELVEGEDTWLRPSSTCVRADGYRILHEQGLIRVEPNSQTVMEETIDSTDPPEETKEKLSPDQRKLKSIFASEVGTAAHKLLENAMRALGYDVEVPFDIPDYYLWGKIDAVRRDPQTGIVEVIDHKVVGRYTFSQITRDKLDPEIKRVSKVYPAETKPQYKRQVLRYMWALAHGNVRGYPPTDEMVGVIHYILRDDPTQEKYAVIEWDPEAQFDAEQDLENLRIAGEKISNGELPDPNVISSKDCSFCEWNKECVFAGQTRERKPMPPQWVLAEQAKAKRERLQKRKADLPITQANLFAEE